VVRGVRGLSGMALHVAVAFCRAVALHGARGTMPLHMAVALHETVTRRGTTPLHVGAVPLHLGAVPLRGTMPLHMAVTMPLHVTTPLRLPLAG
jgi:hypothetical protein